MGAVVGGVVGVVVGVVVDVAVGVVGFEMGIMVPGVSGRGVTAAKKN